MQFTCKAYKIRLNIGQVKNVKGPTKKRQTNFFFKWKHVGCLILFLIEKNCGITDMFLGIFMAYVV